MTKEDAAAALNGSEYTQEGSKELFAEMKAAGLVAVFGASDDLVELRGAVDDEIGAYGGTTFLVDREGLLPNRGDLDDDDALAKFFVRKPAASKIKAKWDDGSGYSWTYSTTIPYTTFDVVETDGDDRELFCRGIVFALADIQ